MNSIKYLLFALIFSFTQAHANNFQFPTITQDDLTKVSEEFMANFTHTSVSGASSLGAIFGFEVGILGGLTTASEVEKVMKRANSSFDVGYLPHAGLMGRVTIPLGLTFELNLIPTIATSSAEFGQYSGAVQWDFFSLPLVNFAGKVHYSKGNFDLKQAIGTDATGSIGYDHTVYGAQVLASINALIIEPYAGLGLARGESDLTFTATAGNNLFSFSDARSASVNKTSLHLLAGANINLLLLNFGVEYANIFGTSRYTGKFTIGF